MRVRNGVDFRLNDTRAKADYSMSFFRVQLGGYEGSLPDKANGSPTSPVFLSDNDE